MNPLYRNVLCPWQTESELKAQRKVLDRLLVWLRTERGYGEVDIMRLLGLDRPDRVWKH
jgi:hypothetical protein